MTSRRHIFVINNPEIEGEDLIAILDEEKWVTFAVCQHEIGASGTSHYQGWVVWSSPIRTGQACARLGGRASVFKQLGSDLSAYEYSTKDETRIDGPWEVGDRPRGRGFRSDIQEIRLALLAGESDKYIVERWFGTFLRFHRGIAAARLTLPLMRRGAGEPIVKVYWGPTGGGKTRLAEIEAGPDAFWMMNGAFMDGYNLEPNVILDDFDNSWMGISLLKRITDEYPVRVPVKFGSSRWAATHIWITSNQHPREWYPEQHWPPLERRFDEVVYFPSRQ